MKFSMKYKLFLALLATGIMLSGMMFVFMQLNFERGFLNYINSRKIESRERLAANLQTAYNRHGSWTFLINNEPLWHQLIMLSDSQRGGSTPPPGGAPRPGRGFAPPNELDPRFALYNADKEPLFAPPEAVNTLDLTPLQQNGETIGYLALVPVKELSETGDLIFAQQQKESFTLIAFSAALLSLLISFPLTSHLLRPVRALTTGTRNLMAGQYKTRIPIISRDELGQLSADFNSLAITLEKNEQARQQWVADISHELRTPLAVLRGEIEALEDGIRSPEPEIFAVLHSETLHLTRLVEDLYELSMSDIGALNYKKINVDPVGILRSSLELYEHRFADKGLKLLPLTQKDLSPSTLADPDRLQQLFTNLLENSLRYTDAPGQLEVTARIKNNTLIIYFADTSPGVAPENHGKLFERLYRVEGSRSRRNGGAGLGLTICRNIVDAHQGEISAQTSKSGGLEITIKIPLQV